MPDDPLKETRLDLFLRLDRLLAEADAVKELRDRLFAEVRATLPPPPDRRRRKEAAHE
jgi:hypothetical protein